MPGLRSCAATQNCSNDPASHLLPRWYREVFWQPPAAFDAAFYEHLDVALPKMKEVVSQLHKAGVRIHVGTDSPNPFVVPGAGFHQELRLLVEAGLTPEEVWLAATRWAGESLRCAQTRDPRGGSTSRFPPLS